MKFLDIAGTTYLWSKIKERFVEKVEGKGLSTNDFTNDLKTKLLNAGTSSFSGNYNDLTNKPTIPKVTNDLTNELKANYDKAYTHSTSSHAPVGAQANVIETIKRNGVALTPTTKAVDINVPTKVSELTNDSGFLNSIPSEYVTDSEMTAKGYQTATQVNTAITGKGYQTAAQVQSAINSALSGITGIDFQVVTTLPASGVKGTIYLKSHGGSSDNIYDEFIWVNSKYEKIGTTDVDLSGYMQTKDAVEITNAEIDAICV